MNAVRLLVAGVLALGSLATRDVRALPLPVQAPAGDGQAALSVFSERDELWAASCAEPPCSSAPVALGLPKELRNKRVDAELVALGEGRHAVVVTANEGVLSFRAVVVAPLGRGAPKLIFAGLTGLVDGQEGARSGPLVQVLPADEAAERMILVGDQQEGVSLCGREAILAPRVLWARDLTLHAAKVQRLTREERASARRVQATRLADGAPRPNSSLLHALAASSAHGSPAALTDGDFDSTWSEDRGGSGRGEFVVLRAPPDLPLTALELSIRPKVTTLDHGAAPERLYLATPRAVIEVSLPEDGWKHAGARYRIALEPPLQGDCLAIVLDRAHDESAAARVTLAEVSATSEFTGGDLQSLVAALAGGGERALAAKSVLVGVGAEGFSAVARAFGTLDEGGRRLALEVMDSAPCAQSAPVYVQARLGAAEAQALHAQARLRRCGALAGPALAAGITEAGRARGLPTLANELVLLDPALGVSTLTPLLEEKPWARRRALRSALALAARSPRAETPLRNALRDASTSDVAALDLLRALGERAPDFEPEASAVLARLTAGTPDLRTRYLSLGPGALLARGSPTIDSWFRRTLNRDADAHVRAAAVAEVREPARYRPELERATADADVRVRESAVRALATPSASFASALLQRRLADDPWPLVRAASADAMSHHPPTPAVAEALTAALADDSQLVRARAIRALGELGVRSSASHVEKRLVDDEEWPEVRAEAARALGVLCSHDARDVLQAFAAKLSDPLASPNAQLVGLAAVLSLGQLAPANLEKILQPLRQRKAPLQAQRAAAAAWAAARSSPCRLPGKR